MFPRRAGVEQGHPGLREPNLTEAAAAGQNCAVCLEDLEEGNTLRVMPCSHCFHTRCIYKWLRASCVCPCCRFKLPSEEEQRILDEREAEAVVQG
ncbi:hypothetical protein PR202_gb16454 [Eleusine coracana subsp. coracana]|uniref:RING-type domain-containing protein n=1 Tax=Eleusine coracana subsp. coracana TaxID=191504 RepID=A0AAV5EY59_ELECO|nr:hypothetical protein PR202_gb16454 [Eleusine coracana subsp. coracana]